MGKITTVRAWANNEVALVAWDIDDKIDGCLGFDVTRVYLNADGSVERLPDGTENRRRCAAWVAFEGQRNPNWIAQDTGVWPVQKLSWRDLTLRKKRDKMGRRPDEVFVRYEIRPVGNLAPGREPVPDNGLDFGFAIKRDNKGKPILDGNKKPQWVRVKAYEGDPRPLGYLAPPSTTNAIRITSRLGMFRSTFTNGILAAQWLRNVLNEDGVIEKKELITKISNPADPHRKYLAGDVIPLMQEFMAREGTFFLSLYELDDDELVAMLLANRDRIHLILSNTAKTGDEWDARNKKARADLMDAGVDIQHRMFNNNTHIGHNKFVVHVPPNGGPRAVLTGSTNWTATGLAGQTNNAIVIENDEVACAFLEYWDRLHQDVLPLPIPFGKAMGDNQPGVDLRKDNAIISSTLLPAGVTVDVWFSPNRPERKKPGTKKKPSPVPPDLTQVYQLMRKADEAILFLAFYPGVGGADSIVCEAIDIGLKDPSLLVTGAVSSAQAMPNYVPDEKDKQGKVTKKGESPTVYDAGNVTIVRAARIEDDRIGRDLGMEQLTAQNGIGAIIHDKVVVIDPRLPTCSVIFGSHNLGYKASYSNDENMVIVKGDQALAAAYAVHILDVYDHYRFRAKEKELEEQGKPGWSGFLETNDQWQDDYVSGKKGALYRYLAR